MPAVAAEFPLAPGDRAIGSVTVYDTMAGDTLMDVARSQDLGFTQLMAVNRGVNPWVPGIGRQITLPNFYLLPNVPRRGIVIDLAAERLYYFPPGKSAVVESYPIGIGVLGAVTPVGVTRIAAKVENPVWYPPPSIHAERPWLPEAIPAGPDNPLGAYAFRLGWPNYLIHGTNKPDGVGRNVSHGCIHLYPEDIEKLFNEVPVGTEVRVVSDDVRVAWVGGELFVEMHPTKKQSDELDIEGTLTPAPAPAHLKARVVAAAGDQIQRVDWSIVRRVADERTGVPTQVTGTENASRRAKQPDRASLE
ncbi:MAG TPA: L,D-transpeptidase family protein [Stellaceae bacterium]|nr:L,D-transpeptidase family protein [Stellaceae bacterium]